MKKLNRIHKAALVVGVALIMAGGASIASAATSSPSPSSSWASWMERMHDSPQMQQIRSQLPPDLQKQCDQMHDSMVNGDWNGTSPGPGMMGGTYGGPGGMMPGWNGAPSGPGMMGRAGAYGSGMMGY